MDSVRIMVVTPSGIRRTMTVPANVPAADLLIEIIGRMQLPKFKDNRPIDYRLQNEQTKQYLSSTQTLESADFKDDDVIFIRQRDHLSAE